MKVGKERSPKIAENKMIMWRGWRGRRRKYEEEEDDGMEGDEGEEECKEKSKTTENLVKRGNYGFGKEGGVDENDDDE